MSDPELLRSFIAIPLPTPVREKIASLQQRLQQALPELRPVPPHNLHLTLHFLGDRTHEQLADIGALMLSIGEKKKIFNVSLETLGVFPQRRQPRVLWLGVVPPDPVIDLHKSLTRGFLKREMPVETRPYRPHLTIGRFKAAPRNRDFLRPFMSQRCGSLTVDRLVLYRSRLTAKGAVHTPLQEVELGAAT